MKSSGKVAHPQPTVWHQRQLGGHRLMDGIGCSETRRQAVDFIVTVVAVAKLAESFVRLGRDLKSLCDFRHHRCRIPQVSATFAASQSDAHAFVWLLAALVAIASTDLSRGDDQVELVVLGVAQDAGLPHVGCQKLCCQRAWTDPSLRRYASCLALIDHASKQRWMFECTPDFAWQLNLLDQRCQGSKTNRAGLDGIFLTHAHIGHYAGLMFLGREALGADGVPVYTMPRMQQFLVDNGPWSQLVLLNNIKLRSLEAGRSIALNERITVEPFQVPHRDEYSETVGFKIAGPERSAVFVPDIDKWERWNQSVEGLIKSHDIALLDATFYSGDELAHRDMSEIPHPFVVESLQRFRVLKPNYRDRIHFIHLNHSNPLHDVGSSAFKQVKASGMHVARRGMRFAL